jgi:hypothetical protein
MSWLVSNPADLPKYKYVIACIVVVGTALLIPGEFAVLAVFLILVEFFVLRAMQWLPWDPMIFSIFGIMLAVELIRGLVGRR